jgi:hypothetical protein
MQVNLEIEGWTFIVQLEYSQHDHGIGHYEFWGHPEYNQEWHWRLDDVEVVEVVDVWGNKMAPDCFPYTFLATLMVNNWGWLERQMLERI